MKNLKVFCLLLMIFIGASCAKDQLFNSPDQFPDKVNSANVISPKIKIAVVSDIHYLDPSLMPDDYVNNTFFQNKMAYDRKLIELSDPIFKQTISELIAEQPDILLITGDLSFEGEKLSHETVSASLQVLEDKGIKVYVIPGNNDIDNLDAMDYSGESPAPVANITPEQFADIYGAFGYEEGEFLYRDVNSLSYICQPCNGLWILGIDAIKYSSSGVSGAINPATMTWIQEKMAEANNNNITVLAMLHYGIIEHYKGQNTLEPLIENSEEIAIALMNAGIRLIFTGHYHANDIVEFTNDGKTLTDIQTGSLVTPLSPYRIMTLDDNFIKIETKRISDVDAELPEGMDFLTYSDVTITNRLNSFFVFYGAGIRMLYEIPAEQYTTVVPFLAKGYKAYLAGDERMDPEERKNIEVLAKSVPSSLTLLNILWTDLPPKDNKIHIKLK